VRNSKQHLFTVAFVGCLWLALILGCTSLKESSNSGQTASPATSPTNTATTSSSPARSATNNSQTNANSPASTAGVTMANFNRLQKGMTYAQVVQILGKEGEESGVLGSGGDKVVMYKWDADEDVSDARLDAFFKNGKLDSKLQFALK
jgi:hypothetical protein